MKKEPCYAKCPDEVFGQCPITKTTCTIGNEIPYCPKHISLNESLKIAEFFLDSLCAEGCFLTSIYMAKHKINQRLKREK